MLLTRPPSRRTSAAWSKTVGPKTRRRSFSSAEKTSASRRSHTALEGASRQTRVFQTLFAPRKRFQRTQRRRHWENRSPPQYGRVARKRRRRRTPTSLTSAWLRAKAPFQTGPRRSWATSKHPFTIGVLRSAPSRARPGFVFQPAPDTLLPSQDPPRPLKGLLSCRSPCEYIAPCPFGPFARF